MKLVKEILLKLFIAFCFMAGYTIQSFTGWIPAILALIMYLIGYMSIDILTFFKNGIRQNNSSKK